MTKIEWTNRTWNPVTGCTAISPGCANCYARAMSHRFHWSFEVTCHPERLDIPLYWRKPRMIFVNSMSDTFHEKVPDDFKRKIFRIILDCPQHTFQVLTKRPENIARIYDWGQNNLWLGVSAETQEWADRRIRELMKIPAAVRFVSFEPLLGPINARPYLERINWCIIGCESGPKRRECKIEWIESLVDQCREAGVPCFVKQVSINGRVSKNPDEWPESIRIREWPAGKNPD